MMTYSLDNILAKSEEKPVIIDFFATWCKPCHPQGLIFDEVSTLYPSLYFIKVDVDKNEKLVTHFKIMGVPTIIVLYKKQLFWRESGIVEKEKLIEQIKIFGT
jgi:thioredoxin 1